MLEQSTLAKFNTQWEGKSPEQIALELASLRQETHHDCDSYYFLVGKDDFISPETGQSVGQYIKDNTPVREKERIVYDDLYKWAKNNEGGLTAWVSPPSESLFPGTKIILHQICKRGREKLVLNRAFLVDIKAEEAVDIANRLAAVSENAEEKYSDPEKVRTKLFNFRSDMGLIALLKLFVDDPELFEQIQTGHDLAMREQVLKMAWQYTRQIQDGVSVDKLYRGMINGGFIGQYDISCPTAGTFSDYIIGHSLIHEGYKLVKNCGQCGVLIDKLIKKGYRCSNCNGEYQGC